LYGKKFTVVTDCKALPSIFTNGTVMNTRLSNWSQQVTEYTFQIIYQPGSQNLVADALSRRGEEGLADSTSSVNASPLTHSVSSTYLHPRPSVISSASLPTDPSAISAAVQFLQHLSLTDLDDVWPAHAQGKLDPGKIGILNVSYRDLEQDKKLDLGSPNLAPYVPAYVNAGEKVEISVDSYAQTLFFGFVAQIQLYRRVTAPDWNVLHSPVGILKTETMDPPDYVEYLTLTYSLSNHHTGDLIQVSLNVPTCQFLYSYISFYQFLFSFVSFPRFTEYVLVDHSRDQQLTFISHCSLSHLVYMNVSPYISL
jgi:hypothetical protein